MTLPAVPRRVALLLWLAPACAGLSLEARKFSPKLGMMNEHGVTRYSPRKIKAVSSENSFWWGDPGNDNRRDQGRLIGAQDFGDNVSWGWHHPNGIYSTIPVGAPLIDDDMNIYLSSDDAIRKFTATGELLWLYAPRGQLASAPSLMKPESRRTTDAPVERADEETEKELRPDWAEGMHPAPAMDLHAVKIQAGDQVAVKAGMSYRSGSKEFYTAGDVGEVMRIITGSDGSQKAMIHWPRTHHNSIAALSSIGKRFVRVATKSASITTSSKLLGTTTSGYIFAIDISTGEELWATQACDQIAGVKGSVSGKYGIVVAATNRCVDRYCWKYRNQTNPFVPSNSVVRGLVASDGSEVWRFTPTSPVWNFVPQYGTDGTVMFSDMEGTTYCLEIVTGALKWQVDGSMGTTTQSFALYLPALHMIYAMGVYEYEHKYCNPFPAPGILPHCGTYPGSAGWVRALNASSGRVMWEYDTPEPPASAAVSQMYSPKDSRLIITMGHNCWFNSGSQIWAIDPGNGHMRWKRDGPTLFTDMCAGDKEGGDIRRAMTGRATCHPGSWSAPVADDYGDVYVGSQVGELQRWGTPDNRPGGHRVQLLSTLNTGVAFQDQAISIAPGMMAVTTCTSLIVFQTSADSPTIGSDLEIGPGAPPEPLPIY